MTLLNVALTLLVTAAMEPLSAAIHRYIGHGVAWPLHRSHHQGPVTGPEPNDVIPAVSALFTIGLFLVGVSVPGWGWLVPVATGATIYGAAYFVLHDLYIHRRLPLLPVHVSWLEPFKQAHLAHHRTGTGAWGILSRPTAAELTSAR